MRKKRAQKSPGLKIVTDSMFGKTTRKALEIRPVSRRRGGGKKGDEMIVLTVTKRNGRRPAARVQRFPADQKDDLFPR